MNLITGYANFQHIRTVHELTNITPQVARIDAHLLKRDELIKEINHHLTNELNIAEEQIHINGMMVLYNNILQKVGLFHY